MLLVLPLLAIPFTTLLFWSQGGGKSRQPTANTTAQKGLNPNLPDARISPAPQDKLTLYQQALKDSQRLEQQRKDDPYNNMDTTNTTDLGMPQEYGTLLRPAPYKSYTYNDPNEEKVNRKLEAFKQSLRQQPQEYTGNYGSNSDGQGDATIVKMQKAMQQLQQSQASNIAVPDPDLEKMDKMLGKIYDIQHPNAVNLALAKESEKHKGLVYSLDNANENPDADLLRAAAGPNLDSSILKIPVRNAAFHELGNDDGLFNGQGNKAVPAFINETQTIVSGSTVKMQLSADIFINGVDIPKGTQVFGACSLDGERMNIAVKSIRYGNDLFPVNLSVYDLDGMPGIRIPGAITRDALKESADQGAQSFGLMTMGDNLATQAASAGIQATKSLFSRKVKLVKATVRAGYPVLLKDNNKKNASN